MGSQLAECIFQHPLLLLQSPFPIIRCSAMFKVQSLLGPFLSLDLFLELEVPGFESVVPLGFLGEFLAEVVALLGKSVELLVVGGGGGEGRVEVAFEAADFGGGGFVVIDCCVETFAEVVRVREGGIAGGREG